MDARGDIDIRRIGRAGRITLTRPQALNALTYQMALSIEAALDEWQAARAVDLVVIDAEGGRAFCAGGDIAQMYATGLAGDFTFGRKFWADEYRLNARIANCTLPYVAMMDGFVMGGGAGISVHGSHRIVTERSQVAMPECGIGLVPDVGCSFILSRAPGHLGEFLAMTGWRMNDGDAVLCGFADHSVAAADLPALTAQLEDAADVRAIDSFSRPPGEASLAAHVDDIGRHFAHGSALDCVRSLEADASAFSRKAAKAIRRACPLSVACAFEIVRRARSLATIEQALALEYRFTWRSASDGDFIEGIRAQIIDKDRDPKWCIARLEDLPEARVEAMLAPLGADELVLTTRETL